MRRYALLMFLATQSLVARPGFAQAPALIPLQGVLEDSSGAPLEGVVDNVVFSIYTAPQAGDLLWSEAHSFNMVQGVFSVYLGVVNQLQLAWFRDNPALWLGIKVADDPEMSRIRLGSVPFAAYSEYSGSQNLGGLSCANGQVAQWNGSEWVCADALGGQVSGIVAGFNVTIDPPSGTGQVTINANMSLQFSEEFQATAGPDPGNCNTGCTIAVDLGIWSFCALSRNEGYVDDWEDTWNCHLTADASNQWQLTALYRSRIGRGHTTCAARCFRQ